MFKGMVFGFGAASAYGPTDGAILSVLMYGGLRAFDYVAHRISPRFFQENPRERQREAENNILYGTGLALGVSMAWTFAKIKEALPLPVQPQMNI